MFLGSGLARGQSLAELRFGLTVAVGLGGLISMGIVVVGTAVTPPLELGALGDVLELRLGGGMRRLFAAGLFAAGLSSAVTIESSITGHDEKYGWRFPVEALWTGILILAGP